jgi:hypothetical protein
MRRVLRYDGLLPAVTGKTGKVEMRSATPDEIGQMKTWIDQRRTETTPFDIVVEGTTPGDDPARAASILSPYAEAGITWWLEAKWDELDLERVLARIRQGPPLLTYFPLPSQRGLRTTAFLGVQVPITAKIFAGHSDFSSLARNRRLKPCSFACKTCKPTQKPSFKPQNRGSGK